MVDLPFARSTYRREVAKEPFIALVNRYVEGNPTLNDPSITALARPVQRKIAEVGTGHIRKVFSQPGTFGDDLFVVSGLYLHRMDNTTSHYQIGQLGVDPYGDVSMCATASIGDGSSAVPPYLFIAEGGILWCYSENMTAQGHLQATGTIANGDVVRIGATYYQFTNGDVNAGTPAGTAGSPWLVAMGISNSTAMNSLGKAIGATGVAGTDYSTALTAHTLVKLKSQSAADLYVVAITAGASGNGIVTTETGAGLAWGGGTLSGGGGEGIFQISVPEDAGAVSVAVINRYVIVVPTQIDDFQGRFYWIRPGEVTIDPLDYATAEREPDKLLQVITSGTMFWLCGQTTTEPWITTGDAEAPMERFQGTIFGQGSWEGTAVQMEDGFTVVDQAGGVWHVSDNGITCLTKTRPDLEERIRKAMQRQTLLT